ncbi:MAG: glycosyltransferase family 4 protein [Candidatus Tectomicrobia bacterium]|uniref:Glycosyltransferase family 4 protein n=1 Tax=Tectimicrobiota bacterium TaxID=2528274 RepID=A0A932GMM7_UNCTE|nr:glycosyltransferase family 4 protein [Candidatus Tectomicrobia bacterium]
MRILYPVGEVFPSPTARSIQIMNTCAALARRGNQVFLLLGKKRGIDAARLLEYYGLLPTPGLEIEFLPILRPSGQRVWRPSWGGLFLFFCRRRLVRLLADSTGKKDTVVFVRHLKLAVNLRRKYKKLLETPLIFEAHEIFSHEKPAGSRLRTLEERAYGGVDGVVAITAHLARMIVETFSVRVPTAVVPDGTRLFTLSPLNSQTPARIVYSGQLYEWKGVDCLLQAMAEVPGARLAILGGGAGGAEQLQRKARSLGIEDRLDFLGQVPHREVVKSLREADVFVLPASGSPISRFWTSPLKLFEYMAAGRPVVASDLPSLREILRHEENALLVEPGNPRALAAAINRILADRGLAQRLAGQALADVREYTWDARAERLERFFAELLT